MSKIAIDDNTWVLVLTGAGVSAESGIPTFRDANGLWENHDIQEVASPEGFERDPALVWRFYSERRAKAQPCVPNAGHLAIAQLEARLGDRFLLSTQNVDGLHKRAGSERVIEMHGNLYTTRCSHCARAPFADANTYTTVPVCDACGGNLRPHIVWFGELLDPAFEHRTKRFMHAADAARAKGGRFLFIAAGTSGVVYPAAAMVRSAKYLGAETYLVNAEPAANTAQFDHFLQGKSAELLPALL